VEKVDLLVISIASPLLIGVYKDSKLCDVFEMEGKTSDILPLLFKDIMAKYTIKELFYVNGPGSYMAIKVAYLFLKTISIVNNIQLKACDGFYLNNNSPIKALGKKYFFKHHDGTIKIDFLDDHSCEDFSLPHTLIKEHFNEESIPSYNLPAI
jgi:hypothetical protein